MAKYLIKLKLLVLELVILTSKTSKLIFRILKILLATGNFVDAFQVLPSDFCCLYMMCQYKLFFQLIASFNSIRERIRIQKHQLKVARDSDIANSLLRFLYCLYFRLYKILALL